MKTAVSANPARLHGFTALLPAGVLVLASLPLLSSGSFAAAAFFMLTAVILAFSLMSPDAPHFDPLLDGSS